MRSDASLKLPIRHNAFSTPRTFSMKQVLIFIVALFLIFALVTQGGRVDIGAAGFIAVLIVSFLISKYAPKLFEKAEGNRSE